MCISVEGRPFAELNKGQSFYLNRTEREDCFIKADDQWSFHVTYWTNMRIALSPDHIVYIPVLKKRKRK